MSYVPRVAAARLHRLLREFPCALVLGPRQCGKSTLVSAELPGWTRMDLERPADLAILTADIQGYLDAHPRRVAFDEAQRLPELFPALRHAIDAGRGKGRFVLTGSASPTLVRSISESLAGRVGLLELTPFRASELHTRPRARSARWFWGGFPPVHARRSTTARSEWLDAYVSTLLERDLPALGLGLPARRLRLLWTMLTHVHGNLLNVADLARSLGVSFHTVAHDLDVLEATFMVRRLMPYFANVQKRLTKSPKIYLRDTGILHLLAGLRSPAELLTWPRRGASFEGLVIEELAAVAGDRLVRPELFFWRTQAGAEVDLLIVHGQRILPVEIKVGASFGPRELFGLKQCMDDLSLKRGWVVTGSGERRSVDRRIEVVPWDDLVSGNIDLG